MGITAEKVAAQWKVSREEQDAFALKVAPEGARRAMDAGEFDGEITPFTIDENVPTSCAAGSRTEAARWWRTTKVRARDTSPEGLAQLQAGVRGARAR